MVLLRHLLGDALRRLRQRQGRTLREVSAAARVSLGYLSEVERGQKEASSELLAAICSALGAPLSQVFREVSDNFALAELQSEPVLAGAREPALDAPATVGMDAPETPQAFTGVAQPIRLGPAERGAGTGPVLDAVQLPPGQTAAFDDEVARRIRDVTDMVPV
jgi:transcriptional regulator with XRE-family HTH domain